MKRISIFLILLLLCYGDFSFDIFFGEISLYSVVLLGGVSCVFVHLLPSSLVLFILGLDSWELFLAGRVVFSVCVRHRYVACRAGTIYLSVGLEWVAGLYGFFFSWALLRWVRYD
jgi:hypothetical protein